VEIPEQGQRPLDKVGTWTFCPHHVAPYGSWGCVLRGMCDDRHYTQMVCVQNEFSCGSTMQSSE